MLGTGYGNSGGALDFYAWDEAGNIYNGTDWVEWSDVDFESYRIAAVEQGTSGRYEAVLPIGTVAYDLRFRGETLADSYLVWADAAQHGLTAGQAAQLGAIEANTDLISPDGLVVVNRDYIVGERITLHQGVDYRDQDGSAIRLRDVGGSALPAAATPVRLNIGSVRYSGEALEVTGSIVADGDDLVAVFDVLATDTVVMAHTGQADYYVYQLVDSVWVSLKIRGACEVARGPRVVA